MDPRGRQSRFHVGYGGARQLTAQRLTRREVAVERGARHAGSLGDVIHAGLLSMPQEDLRRPLEDRRGDAFLQHCFAGPL